METALTEPFIKQRFAIEKAAGRGAFSACWFATDRRAHDRAVVLKVTDVRRKDRATMCRREAAVLKAISHPHIVEVYLDAAAGPYHVCVMEALRGPGLDSLIEMRGALDEHVVRTVAQDVASALVHLHKHGVLHRDVKPDNVICVGATDDQPPTRCVLVDFGLARTLSPADVDTAIDENMRENIDTSLSRLSLDMSAVGHRDYSAPEVSGGASPKAYAGALAPCTSRYGVAADAYALGRTLKHALTGSLAEQTPLAELCACLCRAAGAPPRRRVVSDFRANVSPDCYEAVTGLLKRRPEERTKLQKFLSTDWVRPTRYDDARRSASSPTSYELLDCALDLSARKRSLEGDKSPSRPQALPSVAEGLDEEPSRPRPAPVVKLQFSASIDDVRLDAKE